MFWKGKRGERMRLGMDLVLDEKKREDGAVMGRGEKTSPPACPDIGSVSIEKIFEGECV